MASETMTHDYTTSGSTAVELEVNRFCKDCKFCQPDTDYTEGGFLGFGGRLQTNAWKYARCGRDFTPGKYDPVTGEPEWEPRYCSTMRHITEHCGPEGKYWEPRE